MYRREAALLRLLAVSLTCVAVAAATSTPPTMSTAEQEALFQVMEAMAVDGRRWRETHPAPCVADMWEGLDCEQRSDDGLFHVTGLSFGGKPNPLCSENASLPFAITKLRWLSSLRISTCFDGGGGGASSPNANISVALPPFLHLLHSLLELSIRSNSALSGSIPPELADLSSLQILSLPQNALSGSIPAELSRLRSLQRLDLSDNRLAGRIPAELGSATTLVIIDLSSNALSGPIPPSLGNLTNLRKLDLSLNSLSGGIPLALVNLSALQFLALDHNHLSGPIQTPPQGAAAAAASASELQYLILDGNPINSSLPASIGSAFPSLAVLSLAGCGIYGEIPASVGVLSNLTVLSLEGNKLNGQIPAGLAGLSHIYQLDLSNNSLSGAIPFTQDFVTKLGRGMDLSGNEGLCARWKIDTGTATAMTGLGECSDPRYSAFLTSGGGHGEAERRRRRLLLLVLLLLWSLGWDAGRKWE